MLIDDIAAEDLDPALINECLKEIGLAPLPLNADGGLSDAALRTINRALMMFGGFAIEDNIRVSLEEIAAYMIAYAALSGSVISSDSSESISIGDFSVSRSEGSGTAASIGKYWAFLKSVLAGSENRGIMSAL